MIGNSRAGGTEPGPARCGGSGGGSRRVEGDGLDGALGIELAGERVEEVGEFLVFVVADDEVSAR